MVTMSGVNAASIELTSTSTGGAARTLQIARAWSGSRNHSPTARALMRLIRRLVLAAYLLRVSTSTDATP